MWAGMDGGPTMKEVGLNHQITYSASKQQHAIQHVKPPNINPTLSLRCRHLVIKIWSFKPFGTKTKGEDTWTMQSCTVPSSYKTRCAFFKPCTPCLTIDRGVCEKILRPFKSLTIGCFISDYGFTSALTLTFLLLSAGNSSLTIKPTPVSLECKVMFTALAVSASPSVFLYNALFKW